MDTGLRGKPYKWDARTGRPTKFPEQFQRDSVALVEASGRPIAEVARSLRINRSTLWNWVRDTRRKLGVDLMWGSVTETEWDELARLRKEVIEPRTEKFSAGGALVGVPRSSFYAWLNRVPSARNHADAVLFGDISEIYVASRRTYGIPRVFAQLRLRHVREPRSKVARIRK